jgi:outer membrane protein TolC
MNKTFVTTALFLLTLGARAQSLTLEECYAKAQQNYPLLKQRDLIAKSSAFSIENAAKGYLPQINIAGQASYQSDVTKIPIQSPNVSVLSKDQYKIYADINQPIYEGGAIKAQKKIQEANAQVEQQKLEVELYKLKERVNQVFFGALLIEEQLKQTALLQSDIQLGIRRTQAAVDNGTAFRSSLDLLKAESLKVNQRGIELEANRRAFLEMLALLTGAAISDNTRLETPPATALSASITRPELLLFDHQRSAIGQQFKLLRAKNTPKLNAFFQGGFGRPAFNILSNDFEPYYIGGLRLNFPISGFYSLKNDRNLLSISQKNIDVQQEVFLFNTQYALRQQNAEVKKLESLIQVDEEIIALRNSVKSTAAVQLENGVITSNDYLREVNAEDSAKQAKILHAIQLLLAQYTQRTTAGP